MSPFDADYAKARFKENKSRVTFWGRGISFLNVFFAKIK